MFYYNGWSWIFMKFLFHITFDWIWLAHDFDASKQILLHTDEVKYFTFNLKFKTLDFDVQLKTFSNLIIINIHGIFNNPDCENLRFESRAFFRRSSSKQSSQSLVSFVIQKTKYYVDTNALIMVIRNIWNDTL